MKRIFLFYMIIMSIFLTSCGKSENSLKDGYYTAQISDYDSHGWKEFITICVQDGEIVTVEYNAENKSGFIKAWDMSYMKAMNMVTGTYPNRYTRTYSAILLKNQSADNIDAVTGASHSYLTFEKLAEAVIKKSMEGDMTVAVVDGE